jgi:hypothetical protein
VAETSYGLGVTSTSYNLDYTGGKNAVRDMKAIEIAAKQQEVEKVKSASRKLLVGKALGIKQNSNSYSRGIFKQQWIAFLKSTAK